MLHYLPAFADIAIPPPPPPPPPPDGFPPLLMVAAGLGAMAAVCLLVFLWRRSPASPPTPAAR